MIRAYAAASFAGSCRAGAVVGGDVGDDQLARRDAATPARAGAVVGDAAAVGQHGVRREVGACSSEDREVVGGPKPVGLARLRVEVEHHDQPAVGLDQGLRAARAPAGAGSPR